MQESRGASVGGPSGNTNRMGADGPLALEHTDGGEWAPRRVAGAAD